MTSSIATDHAPHDDALDADYRRAGFNGQLPFGQRPALLLVDVVMAYVQPGSALYADAFVAALPANERLVAAARSAGVPVIFTSVVYGAGGLDGGLFYKKVPVLQSFLAGSPLAAFVPTLIPAEGDVVVVKQYASAFFGTSLASTLRSMGVDTLLVTGFSTSGCVRATALDALQHGFAPFVVRDACADRDPAPHLANLFDLQNKYAEVIDSVAAISAIQTLAGASHGD